MISSIITAMLVIKLSVFLHFMGLRMISRIVGRDSFPASIRVIAVIYLIVLVHLVEVFLFGVGYYVAENYLGAGSLTGEFSGDFREYIYYSLVSYTSLGLGDVYPQGPIRLITGLEALTGLLMIGWSASFTYIFMSKFWKDL